MKESLLEWIFCILPNSISFSSSSTRTQEAYVVIASLRGLCYALSCTSSKEQQVLPRCPFVWKIFTARLIIVVLPCSGPPVIIILLVQSSTNCLSPDHQITNPLLTSAAIRLSGSAAWRRHIAIHNSLDTHLLSLKVRNADTQLEHRQVNQIPIYTKDKRRGFSSLPSKISSSFIALSSKYPRHISAAAIWKPIAHTWCRSWFRLALASIPILLAISSALLKLMP